LTATGKRDGVADGMLHAAIDRIALPNLDIEVWLARLDLDAAQIRHCLEHLSQAELQRAARFHFERDRRRFVCARGILRMLLSTHLDIMPAEIAFAHTRNGKPIVADCAARIHFNLSHSGERALYALSRTCEPGVDIEYLNRDIDYSGLAKRFFTRHECAALRRIPESGRKRAFFACWTRKEAVIKAAGDGLSLPLDQFEVTLTPDAALRLLDPAVVPQLVGHWDLYAPDIGNDYTAAVAARRRE
jgi:4'-phosphopantetheinyl transferase